MFKLITPNSPEAYGVAIVISMFAGALIKFMAVATSRVKPADKTTDISKGALQLLASTGNIDRSCRHLSEALATVTG